MEAPQTSLSHDPLFLSSPPKMDTPETEHAVEDFYIEAIRTGWKNFGIVDHHKNQAKPFTSKDSQIVRQLLGVAA